MSALPIGGEGGDTPRRGVPAENEAVPGGGASRVREEMEPEISELELDDANGVSEFESESVRVGCGARAQ